MVFEVGLSAGSVLSESLQCPRAVFDFFADSYILYQGRV